MGSGNPSWNCLDEGGASLLNRYERYLRTNGPVPKQSFRLPERVERIQLRHAYPVQPYRKGVGHSSSMAAPKQSDLIVSSTPCFLSLPRASCAQLIRDCSGSSPGTLA